MRPRSAAVCAKTFLSDLRDLKVGDLVVHVDHGIGEFVGLKQLGGRVEHRRSAGISRASAITATTSCSSRSSASISIQKYTGGTRPALDRLGGTTWEKAKTRVKKAMRDMAEELLKLYAQRKAVPGHAFSPDTHWQEEFEGAFPYELTPDQATAIVDIKRDMEAGHADGSPAVRRRRVRQDGSRDARRVQGRDGRQAGRVSRADDGAGVSAPEDAARSVCGLSRDHRHGQPVPHQAGNEGDS